MAQFNKTLLATLATVIASGANSAAFQLAEVSTSGLGMAYAGNSAVADNASVVASNPALMTQFKQTSLSAGGILVDGNVDIYGNLAGADLQHKDAVPRALVPNAYIVVPVSENFSLGGGANVNYGLKSEFPTDYNAGMYGGTTELTAVNLNLSAAYRFTPGFSFGAGFNAVHSKAELSRNLGIGNTLLSNSLGAYAAATSNQLLSAVSSQIQAMPQSTEVAHIKGDKWSYGWNVGATYDFNENHRIGLAYHSHIDVKFKGLYSNQFPTAYNPVLTALAAQGVALPMTTATGSEKIAGSLVLNLPAYWELSGYHKLTDRLAMQYSWKYTQWSRLKALTAYGETGNLLFHKDENFNNSSRYALGFSYDVSPELTVRTGIAYDENASKAHSSISIPDTDRTWYSVGATYRFTPNLSTDVGYSFLKGRKREFTEGSAKFNTHSNANLFGLNINYQF